MTRPAHQNRTCSACGGGGFVTLVLQRVGVLGTSSSVLGSDGLIVNGGELVL